MEIYFIRHGHPDYKHDCLTELGEKQAKAAAERLKDCGIEHIFSSTNGRALQTASYTAEKLNLEVVPCDFLRETPWRPLTDDISPSDSSPWSSSNLWVSEGKDLCDKDWASKEPFCKTMIVDSSKRAYSKFDELLADFGYQREGDYYRVTKEDTNKTIAVFSHCAASSCIMSHMLNIPLPIVFGSFFIECSSVCALRLPDKFGDLIFPRLTLFNDMSHAKDLTVENVYGI